MRLIVLHFVILFSCLSFNSHGNDSLTKSITLKFYKNNCQKKARLSENDYRITSGDSAFNKLPGFQLYQRQQASTFKIYLLNNEIKTKTGSFLANKSDFRFFAGSYHDSVAKKSNAPLLRNEHAGIWKKVGRAELYIGGVEVIGMVTLILLPKEITKWPDDWAQDAWRNLKRAFTTTPVWDKDDWALNYIGHPIAGSYYYNALRSQNASRFHSFLFSTAQSFIWEYIIEGVAEKPSTQDLIVTPIAGAILGESTHRLTMNMRRNGFNFFEKVFVVLFNPMFVLNNGFGPRFNPVRKNHAF